MIFNINRLIQFTVTFVLLLFSLNFFYSGYFGLKNINFNEKIEIEEKKASLNQKKIIQDNNVVKIPEKIELEEEIIKINEKEIIIIVKKNDTFSEIIDPYFKNKKNKNKLIEAINKKFNLKKLNIGQKIIFYIDELNKNQQIVKVIMPINFNTDLVVTKSIKNSNYLVEKIQLPIKTDLVAKKYEILNSLYSDGREADIPLTVLAEIIRLYSFDIDFQRDIKKNNQLEVLYEVFHNENNRTVSYGEIKYVNLIFKKKNLEYFIFKTSDGFTDYYNREGKNVKKTLMKTPLDGARLSSSFGMRKHPILGYNVKHLGVDFAAPIGTPVYAAGNGIIEFVGRNGGYGKYIRIRHNGSYKTAYAHLNSYNKGITLGARVNQGQTIGFVGSTGRSTGPHLHYEIIYQNKKINPMKLKLPSGKTLKNKELENFKITVKEIYSNFLFHLFE